MFVRPESIEGYEGKAFFRSSRPMTTHVVVDIGFHTRTQEGKQHTNTEFHKKFTKLVMSSFYLREGLLEWKRSKPLHAAFNVRESIREKEDDLLGLVAQQPLFGTLSKIEQQGQK